MASEYPLHACVFANNKYRLSKLIDIHDIAQKDKHGNTPLHLATMLGHRECVDLLLAHNAPVKRKNLMGWTPLAEAISYGNRQIVASVLQKMKQQTQELFERRRPVLISALRDFGDFYMELKWEFHSWVPFLSRVLPSDVCKIYKQGSSLRLDTTLVDFKNKQWERGDVSLLFNGDDQSQMALIMLDNRRNIYQKIRYEESAVDLEADVDIFMSSDIVAAEMSTENITFTRVQDGLLFREDKTRMVGEFSADFYYMTGLVLQSRKRREHLSAKDVQKNKAVVGKIEESWEYNQAMMRRRPSVPPPDRPSVTWEEYINSDPRHPPCLGRQLVAKECNKHFKATIAMSENFPMSVQVLLDVLEVVAPFKQFQRLRDFITSQLPPGFPVCVEIPVFTAITAKVTFSLFEWRTNMSSELFSIPVHYSEDMDHFSDL